jgi:hypothetical protein
MSRFRHRLAVYYGLREGPLLEGRSEAAQPDALTVLIGLPLGVAVMVAILGAIVWLERLLAGGNTSLESVAWTGFRLLWALVVIGALARAIAWMRRRRRR